MMSNKKLSFNEDDDDSSGEERGRHFEKLPAIAKVIKSSPKRDLPEDKPKKSISTIREGDHPEQETDTNGDVTDSAADAKERRLKEIRKQIQAIKQQIEEQTEHKTLSERRKAVENCDTATNKTNPDVEDSDKSNCDSIDKKSKNRERETVELVTDFRKRMKEASKCIKKSCRSRTPSDDDVEVNPDLLALADSDDWLVHKFDAKDDSIQRLAKDANTKDDTWHPIDDPRNSMSRRRAESSSLSSNHRYPTSADLRSHGESRHRKRHKN